MDIGFEDGRRNFGRNFGFENEREAAAAAAAAAASAHSALHFSLVRHSCLFPGRSLECKDQENRETNLHSLHCGA